MLTDEVEKCFPVLADNMGTNELRKFGELAYGDLWRCHFGIGMWIRKNLLNEKSALYQWFLHAGITDKDDMSSLIICLFYINTRLSGLRHDGKKQ